MAGWFCERDQKPELKEGFVCLGGMDVDLHKRINNNIVI
jgi:hypothetical protein